MAISISSGNEYSYSFVLQDGKAKQSGNCVVTNINMVQIQFTDTATQVKYIKKLNEVKFDKPKTRSKK